MLCRSRPTVSSLSAAIPYAASRRTAAPGPVTLLSRADLVPGKAATDLAKGRAWPDTEEVERRQAHRSEVPRQGCSTKLRLGHDPRHVRARSDCGPPAGTVAGLTAAPHEPVS